MTALPNLVLVHGAWADGSSWSAIIEQLQADGYSVTALQFSLTRLADDVARLRQVLMCQNGPTVVVGHTAKIGEVHNCFAISSTLCSDPKDAA